jgi:stage III sporulation protein SpoIIIAA
MFGPPPASAVAIKTRTDDLHLLIATLPVALQSALQRLPLEDLVEIVMDLGRPAQARFPERAETLLERPVAHDDLAHVLALVGEFTADNRAGIEGTLHRISALRNRREEVVGLTLRVGRAVFGTIDLIRDLVEDGASLLLLGRPGSGKTTKLREIARILADDAGKRVIVIDTSNEIAGDGDVPHPAIGSARRMQVPHPDRQHAVMIEAVENHMPEVVIVDEIGTVAEANAARTIAERGVQLIGTAHGNTLENLVSNPTLADLVGGVHTVTLSDEEARLRRTQKTVIERKGPPTFSVVVEILSRDEVAVHPDTAAAVDALLRGVSPAPQRRHQDGGGLLHVPPVPAARTPAAEHEEASGVWQPTRREGPVRIYPYALSRDLLERVIRDLRLDARVVNRVESADFIVALRGRAEDPRLQRLLAVSGVPLYVTRKNTTAQLRRLLQDIFLVMQGVEDAEIRAVVHEVEEAVQRVKAEGVPVELSPRRPALRKVQHRMVSRHQLVAESVGSEPVRYLVVHPAEQLSGSR